MKDEKAKGHNFLPRDSWCFTNTSCSVILWTGDIHFMEFHMNMTDHENVAIIIRWISILTGYCGPGHWCVSGIDRQYPNGINNSVPLNNTCYDDRQLGYGGICPVGHYCPGGLSSIYPIKCSNGTYSNTEGLAQCITCPEGQFHWIICLQDLKYHLLSVYSFSYIGLWL